MAHVNQQAKVFLAIWVSALVVVLVAALLAVGYWMQWGLVTVDG